MNGLKAFRNDLGISLRKLSELCGYSYSYLSEIENGKRNPSIKVLRKIVSSMGGYMIISIHDSQAVDGIVGFKEHTYFI